MREARPTGTRRSSRLVEADGPGHASDPHPSQLVDAHDDSPSAGDSARCAAESDTQPRSAEELTAREAIYSALEVAVKRARREAIAGDEPVGGTGGWVVRWKPRRARSMGGDAFRAGDAYLLCPEGLCFDSLKKARRSLGLGPEVGLAQPESDVAVRAVATSSGAVGSKDVNSDVDMMQRSGRAEVRARGESASKKRTATLLVGEPAEPARATLHRHARPSGVGAAAAASKTMSARQLGRSLVGSRLSVWWEEDEAWYEGTVRDFSGALGEHVICYDDGEQRDEALDRCRWRLLSGASSDAIASSAGSSRESRVQADGGDQRPPHRSYRPNQTICGKGGCILPTPNGVPHAGLCRVADLSKRSRH